jgi:hypothetical protein
MRKNIGTWDRIVRLCIGLFSLALGIWWVQPLFIIIALFTFFEAISGWCAFYQLIGRNTCSLPRNIAKKAKPRSLVA